MRGSFQQQIMSWNLLLFSKHHRTSKGFSQYWNSPARSRAAGQIAPCQLHHRHLGRAEILCDLVEHLDRKGSSWWQEELMNIGDGSKSARLGTACLMFRDPLALRSPQFRADFGSVAFLPHSKTGCNLGHLRGCLCWLGHWTRHRIRKVLVCSFSDCSSLWLHSRSAFLSLLQFCAAKPMPPCNVTQAASLSDDFLCFCDYQVSLWNIAAWFPREPGTIWSGTAATLRKTQMGGTLLGAAWKWPSSLVFQPEPRCWVDGPAGGLLDCSSTRGQKERPGEEGPLHYQKHTEMHFPVPPGQQVTCQWWDCHHSDDVHDCCDKREEQER